MLLTFPAFLKAGELTKVDGIVNTSKDTSGNTVAVKLNLSVEGGEVFNIVLDETGRKLSIEMEGEWVEVTGEVYDRDRVIWMEIKSYEKFEENIFK
jgi:RecJ-like exonuclease